MSESEATVEQLLDQLQQDRRWLLRQLDEGRWPEQRLDLAPLLELLDGRSRAADAGLLLSHGAPVMKSPMVD